MVRLRVGRRVGKNLYLQLGSTESDNDVPIGQIIESRLAQTICDRFNQYETDYVEDANKTKPRP